MSLLDKAKALFGSRGRQPFLPPGRRFATTVTVEWTYAQARLPGRAALAAMGRLEDLIVALEGAVLMRVRTGFGSREWLIYTEGRAHFMARLNAALTGRPPHPTQAFAADDPEGREWETSMGELGGILKR